MTQTASNDGYTALDTMAMPDEGWATALQQDDRAPSVQITKSVGGSSGTYLADYFYINKAGTRIARRGGNSGSGGNAGPFYLNLNNDAGDAWWNIGGDLSLAAAQLAVLLVVTYFARSICLSSSYNLAHPETLVGGKRRTKWFVAKESL